MMQAILTKYIGPTDFRGARVKAIAQAGSRTVGWDDALNPQENHENAARELAGPLGWLDQGERLQGGWLPSGEAVWVLCEKEAK